MSEIASFAAGCFWGVETEFQRLPGVLSTTVGYAGGITVNPTYEDVCTGTTGHAETVLVEYDPKKVSYEQLLAVFFQIHDPSTPNRQGPDIGTQYRSVIFTHTPEQEREATAFISRMKQNRKIVTEVAHAGPFYRAEEYHQKYHQKHGGCNI